MRRIRVRGLTAGVTLCLTLSLTSSLTVGGVATAEPTPPPPPGPAAPAPPPPDTAGRAGQVGELVARVARFEEELGRRQADVGDRQELANRAFADDSAARARAAEAHGAAAQARVGAEDAAARLEDARRRVDEWITAWFQQADATSVASVLAGSTTPDQVLERAQLRDAVTAEQRATLDAFDRERIASANADSLARAARAEADGAAVAAAGAGETARRELEQARASADETLAGIEQVRVERDAAEAGLRSLEASDAALAAQRRRAEAFEERARRSAEDEDASQASAARSRLARAGAGGDRSAAEAVIDRALSAIGTEYAWGGGDADGPTRGIRDGGVADSFGDYAKTGFDCSGLMIYAFAAVGKSLPHYSGYQATAGPRVPLEQRRPGDMLFWADDEGVHHVALYLGNDRMVEAPQSGSAVRISRVRFDDEITPTVTRLL